MEIMWIFILSVAKFTVDKNRELKKSQTIRNFNWKIIYVLLIQTEEI